jgi:hypothetical protein
VSASPASRSLPAGGPFQLRRDSPTPTGAPQTGPASGPGCAVPGGARAAPAKRGVGGRVRPEELVGVVQPVPLVGAVAVYPRAVAVVVVEVLDAPDPEVGMVFPGQLAAGVVDEAPHPAPGVRFRQHSSRRVVGVEELVDQRPVRQPVREGVQPAPAVVAVVGPGAVARDRLQRLSRRVTLRLTGKNATRRLPGVATSYE